MKKVILESPFAGDVEGNVNYARGCLRDCLLRNEAPIASHLLYTQPGVLDDNNPDERKLGIEAGLLWGSGAEKSVVYLDRGISSGMKWGIERAGKEGRPVEYRTLHPIKIMTITGASGAGKTSIASELLRLKPDRKLVISLTTRDPRPSDLPGEYRCNVPIAEFEESTKFIWVVSAHSNRYGTLLESVNTALAEETLRAMILVPEAVGLLRKHTKTKREGSVLSFYLLSPPEEELRRRMKLRGEDEATIEKRIKDCKEWDEEARRSDTPYIFVSNNVDKEAEIGIGKTAREILMYLS